MIELKEHNKRPYEELCRMLEEHDKCAYVSATGTGKSYVVGKYIEEHDLVDKTLMLVPSNAIKKSWQKLLPGMEIKSYQWLAKDERSLEKYELIACDEIHHLGAEKWGDAFDKSISAYSGKVIGMTATPVRFLDQCRDMTQEVFEGHVVEGLNLPQAINQGILPPFEYTTALFTVPKCKTREYSRSKTTEKLYKQLMWMENEYSFEKILREHLPSAGGHKVAVFVDSIDKLSDVREMMEGLYAEARHFTVHSKMPRSRMRIALEQFSQNEGMSIIYSVNMLNEGIHVKGVDTVVMFRKTESPVVYLQQIGRALSADVIDKKVKIFDFVGNHVNLKEKIGSGSEVIQWITSETGKSVNQIIVRDYAMEEFEVIKKLNGIFYSNWTEEEKNIVREFYNQDNGINKILEKLPERTYDSVRSQAAKLGLTEKKETSDLVITPQLETDIRKYYGTKEGNKVLYDKYPDVNKRWLRSVANRIGIRCFEPWTELEDKIIISNASNSIRELMEMLPGRTKECICGRRRKLGVAGKGGILWTEEELELIKEHQELTAAEIRERYLPHRNEGSIIQQRNKMGIKKRGHYIDEDRFKKLYAMGGKNAVHSSPEFEWMSLGYIGVVSRKFGVSFEETRKGGWTDEENEMLLDYLSRPKNERESVRVFAQKFPDRTYEAVWGKIKWLREKEAANA